MPLRYKMTRHWNKYVAVVCAVEPVWVSYWWGLLWIQLIRDRRDTSETNFAISTSAKWNINAKYCLVGHILLQENSWIRRLLSWNPVASFLPICSSNGAFVTWTCDVKWGNNISIDFCIYSHRFLHNLVGHHVTSAVSSQNQWQYPNPTVSRLYDKQREDYDKQHVIAFFSN